MLPHFHLVCVIFLFFSDDIWSHYVESETFMFIKKFMRVIDAKMQFANLSWKFSDFFRMKSELNSPQEIVVNASLHVIRIQTYFQEMDHNIYYGVADATFTSFSTLN